MNPAEFYSYLENKVGMVRMINFATILHHVKHWNILNHHRTILQNCRNLSDFYQNCAPLFFSIYISKLKTPLGAAYDDLRVGER